MGIYEKYSDDKELIRSALAVDVVFHVENPMVILACDFRFAFGMI